MPGTRLAPASSASYVSREEISRMQSSLEAPEKQLAALRASHAHTAVALRPHREARKIEDEPNSESERLKAAEDAAVRARALHLLEEQKDEVKRMNQMMLYSQCVAVRDEQIKEKKQREQEEVDLQKILDSEVELSRLQQLAVQEEAEKVRFERQRAGMAVLEEQLQEQEELRAQKESERRMEQVNLEKAIAEAQAVEARLLEEKRTAGAALLEQVMAENAVMIERKKLEKAREVEEDLRILAYIQEQDAKALALVEEKAQAFKARELEIAHLRAQQETVQDQEAQRDELRARRWQEAAARREREATKAEAVAKAEQQRALNAARQAQAASKANLDAALAQADAAEFQAAVEKARLDRQKQIDEELDAASKKKAHLMLLQAQVEEREKARHAAKATRAAEGQAIKQQLELERSLIEGIRQKKLQELVQSGVPSKYLAQLTKENFTKEKLGR